MDETPEDLLQENQNRVGNDNIANAGIENVDANVAVVFSSYDYSTKSATELFELFFNVLLQEEQRYALLMNFPDPKVTHLTN